MIDIIVVWWNNNELTLKCLESIVKYTPTTIPHRLILVNNGSDDSAEVTDKAKYMFWPQNLVMLQNARNLGWVKGANQGFREFLRGHSTYAVLLNNDTEVAEGWLEKMKKKSDEDKELAIVSPLVDVGDQDISKDKYKAQKYVPFLPFVCSMFKRSVLETIGLLDEEIENGKGDDMDYCIRAKKAGWHLAVVDDVVIHHEHQASFNKVKDLEELQHRNRTYVNKKHGITSGMENDPRYII